MTKTIKYVGLDVHKNSINIAIADEGRNGDVRYYGKIDNMNTQLDKVIRKIISTRAEVRCVYEAGPCGYDIYRHLSRKNIDCMVVAPALIPRKSADRIKNDRRDAVTLAKLHRSGELTPVYVPSEDEEALRDMSRCREDAQKALRVAKQQLNAFLLRLGKVYSGRTKWSKAHFNWLSEITMPHRSQQLVLQEYIDTVNECAQRVDRITRQLVEASKACKLAEQVKFLQSLRGISQILAIIITAELGDLKRFKHPSLLMAYLGLVPSEHSSGDKIRKGGITKTGNGHVRCALVEAAQAYRLPARKSRPILKRQEDLPDNIKKISWKAQLRLCGRFQRLLGRGKKPNIVITAIARELAGFAWAIAQEVPQAA